MPQEQGSVDERVAQLCQQIGARIAELRRDKGWSQKQFAQRLNSSIQWISAVETGKQNFRVHTLARLAHFLEVEVVSLFVKPGPEPDGVKRGRPRTRTDKGGASAT